MEGNIMKCTCCGKQLNKSIYKDGKNYKSCPKCSSNNGDQHVFYRYPERFGTTPPESHQIIVMEHKVTVLNVGGINLLC